MCLFQRPCKSSGSIEEGTVWGGAGCGLRRCTGTQSSRHFSYVCRAVEVEETKTKEKGILGSRIIMSKRHREVEVRVHRGRPATWQCCGENWGVRQEQTSKAERNVRLKGFM